MKKFYIPTTTLNFNNILSSESISPKAFYSRRKFGYQRWENIPENNLENSIVLYGSMCTFSRPESDVEDHPLLIEVQLDESKFSKISDEVYLSDKTIYLTPLTCNFIFFNQKDKTTALSMSTSSSETKLVWIYSKHIVVNDVVTEQYQPLSIDDLPLNESEIDKDIRLNKLKGLLYGYYIGARLSSSKENVTKLNVRKEIYNIFASILANSDKRPTAIQDNRLDELFDNLNGGNPLQLDLMRELQNESLVKRVISIVKRHTYLKTFFDKDSKLSELHYSNSEDGFGKNPAMVWIGNLIESQKRDMSKSLQLLSPKKAEIVVVDLVLNSVRNELIDKELDKMLFKGWVNEIFINPEYNNKINSYSEKLSDDITIKAKGILQGDWDNSEIKVILNGLRKLVRGTDFNIQYNNDLLSSIASVLIAGENWEKLLAFMQSKEMTDYRLAFSIWGELNGFANLTRDFTDIIFRNISSSYLMDLYKEFHGQLHNETLEVEIKVEAPVSKESPVTEVEAVTVTSKISPLGSEQLKLPKSLTTLFHCKAFEMLGECQDWFKKQVVKIWADSGKKTVTKSIKDLIAKLPQSPQCPVQGLDRIWETCMKTLDSKESKCKKAESKDPSLFDSLPYFDFTRIDSLRGLDSKVVKRLIDNWNYVCKKQSDKKEQVSFFMNLCKKDGRGDSDHKELAGLFNEDFARKIYAELIEKYVNTQQ